MNPTHKPWTNHQERDLLYFFERGFTNKQIARKIGRTPSSVRTRLNRHFGVQHTGPRHKACVTTQVPKADLAAWYVLGWKLSAFDGDICTVGWPNRRKPEYPGNIPVFSADREFLSLPEQVHEVAA